MQIFLDATENIYSPTTWTLENAIFSFKMEKLFEFNTDNVFVADERKYTKFTHTHTHTPDSIW